MKLKTFEGIIEVIFPVRDRLGDAYEYSFPNHPGMAKAVIDGLSEEAIKAMQDILKQKHATKKAFSKAWFKRMKELGETVE